MTRGDIGSYGRRLAAVWVLLTLGAGVAWAQGEVPLRMFAGGVKAGVSVGDYRLTSPYYSVYDHRMSVNGVAGAWIELRTKSGFGLRPEVAYMGKGVSLEWEDVRYRMRANCLDVRMGLLYNISLKKTLLTPYLVAAPTWSMAMDGRVDYEDCYTGEVVMQLSGSNMRRHELGVFCGFGLEYPLHGYGWAVYLSGEVGYNWGLTNSFTRKEQGYDIGVLNPSLDGRPAMDERLARGIEVTLRVGVPFGKVIKWRKETKEKKAIFLDDD